jgi:hypothetical protein
VDYDIEIRFRKLKTHLEKDFGEDMDVQAILFLIGVDEVGLGYQNYSKQQKTDLIHVAICTILEPSGYYEFEGRDEDNWPHFKLVKELPVLDHRQQQHLMKEALIEYFVSNELYHEEVSIKN